MERRIDPTPLTPKQLQEYRKWLAELAAEAAATGEYGWCDPEVWEYFDPHTRTGEQILSSLTERELFEPVLATMDHPGHTPDFNRVYVIYRKYLSWRYGSMNAVKFRARALYKQRAAKRLCPPDWLTRVSAAPLIAKCEEQGISVSREERARLEALCAGIVKRGQPVLPETLPADTRGFLNRLAGSWRNALELMGIPVVTKQQMPNVQSNKDKRKGT